MKFGRSAFALSAALFTSSAYAQFTVNVSGDLDWRDGQNNLHDMRLVKVEVWTSPTIGSDTLEATVNADLYGHYAASFQSFAPGFLSCYLKLYAVNVAGFVSSDGTAANTYVVQTPSTAIGAGDNFISANLANTNPTVNSFSVVDAILTGYQYTNEVRGAARAQGELPRRQHQLSARHRHRQHR